MIDEVMICVNLFTLHIGAIRIAPSQNSGFLRCKRRTTAPPIDSPIKNFFFFGFSPISAMHNKQNPDYASYNPNIKIICSKDTFKYV